MSSFVGVALLLSPAPSPAEADGLRLVDLTGEFDRFATTTADMPDGQRVEAFETRIGPMAGGFYSRERRPGGYSRRVIASLNAYPRQRAGMAIARRDFGEQFAPARRKFENYFGRVASEQPVYLIDSMGELDGGTRELNGENTLLFGLDVIADEHSSRDLSAFFYHELFHLYQEARLTDCAAVWCTLWAEGLATYVASRLDPNASDDELILNLPNPIRPAVEADRSAAVCAVARRLQSTSDEDFSALFQGDAASQAFHREWAITWATSSRKTLAKRTAFAGCPTWDGSRPSH